MNGVIQCTNEASQTLVSNSAPVKFSNVDLRTNSANCFNGWLNYNEGSAQFNILEGGRYRISFNTNITGGAGVVALGLYTNGIKQDGAETNTTIATANNYENVSIRKEIRVCGRGNVSVTIQSVPSVDVNGVATATQIPTLKNSIISIERLS